MKQSFFFSLLLLLALASCTTISSNHNKIDNTKDRQICLLASRYPTASVIGVSGYALSQQLDLYYSRISNNSALVCYDRDGLTGNIIGVMSSDILFDFDKYELCPREYSRIDTLLFQLQNNGFEKGISIIGHTDSIGAEQYNFALSQKRANSVRDYIVSRYQGTVKINTTLGLGESQPIVENDTPENRQLNRRVEIIIEK